jgi:hypothetical protein
MFEVIFKIERSDMSKMQYFVICQPKLSPDTNYYA